MTTSKPIASSKVLTPADVKAMVKPGSFVLWPYRGRVEEGEVLFVDKGRIYMCWLEGYQSRNDDVAFDEVLAVHDPAAPEHSLPPFSGKGYLTEAGVRWQTQHAQQSKESAHG